MSLQSRLAALITAIGADIKTLKQDVVQSSGAPRARVSRITSNDATIGNNTGATLVWNNEITDPHGMWDPTNPTRMTCVKPGPHAIVAEATLASDPANSKFWMELKVTRAIGGAVENVSRGPGGVMGIVTAEAVVDLAVGDYVEVTIFNATGASITPWGSVGVGAASSQFHIAAIVGPKGDKGDKGDTGNQFFDTTPIGSVIAWSRKTYPSDFVLADGQRLSKALFPDAYAVAQAEIAAGNPMWTVRASDETFTVPNLTDKFLLAPGAARLLGATGGAETHTLTVPEMPAHSHGTGQPSPNQNFLTSGTTAPWTGGSGGGSLGQFPNTGETGGGGAHNNMPPYIVLAQIVKVKGVTVSAGVLQGPTGQSGALAKSGLAADMPSATIDTKGWLYTATDQGVTYANLDGSNWVRWAADAPAGGLEDFGGFTLPPGWLEADGTAINRASYSRLFGALTRTFSGSTVAAPAAGANVISNVLSASLTHIGIGCAIEGPGIPTATVVIGLSADSGGFRNITLSKNATATNSGATFRALPYGGADGSTTFNLPDFRGRVTVASGANAGLTERKLGWKDGEETHQLTVAEMPSHAHQQQLGWNAGPYTLPYWDGNTGRAIYGDSAGTGGSGGNQSHNNMPPFNVARKIIKVY